MSWIAAFYTAYSSTQQSHIAKKAEEDARMDREKQERLAAEEKAALLEANSDAAQREQQRKQKQLALKRTGQSSLVKTIDPKTGKSTMTTMPFATKRAGVINWNA